MNAYVKLWKSFKGGSLPLAQASSVARLPAGSCATPSAGDTPATPPFRLFLGVRP